MFLHFVSNGGSNGIKGELKLVITFVSYVCFVSHFKSNIERKMRQKYVYIFTKECLKITQYPACYIPDTPRKDDENTKNSNV